MAKSRSYNLLCPIARGLDRIGDRWTLLILRDLHAGPARFSELQRGLKGIAANLLTDRLAKLVSDGMIEKIDGDHGVSLYGLTKLGAKTQNILFDLALFGGQFPAEAATAPPSNMRSLAVTLATACDRVAAPNLALTAQLVIEGEALALVVEAGQARVNCGTLEAPDVTLTARYEAMLAVSEGEISLDVFAAEHATLTENVAGKMAAFVTLMSQAMALLQTG
jgi:DNA-binding HxlR family transcriptional regulator